MATWYVVVRWRDTIEPIEVTRWTDASVFTPMRNGKGEDRRARNSDSGQYFETWGEAYSYLLSRCQRAVENARNQLARQEAALSAVEQIKPPAP